MPELFHERREWEAEFTRRLNALNRHHQAIIVEAMGTPPNPHNVPEELWQRLEADERRSDFWILLLAMLGSYRVMLTEWGVDKALRQQLRTITPPSSLRVDYRVPRVTGPMPRVQVPSGSFVLPPEATGLGKIKLPRVPDIVGVQARQIAATHAERLASQTTATTRRRLIEAYSKTQEPTAEQPPAKPDMDPVEVEIERSFGESRAEGIAITEITRAIGNGERIAAHEVTTKLGWRLARVWQTERDEKVCPICSPLQGTVGPFTIRSSQLIDQVPGPPAHPRCRCWLTWKVLNRPRLSPRGVPEPDSELVAA